MSYDSWLTQGADTGLDGPFVCEPCFDGDCELCEPEQCECDNPEHWRREVVLTLPEMPKDAVGYWINGKYFRR